MKQPRPPADLGTAGKALWRAILADAAGQGVELDAKELVFLRQAGKIADAIAIMETSLAGADLVVSGSTKQPVANPLIPELRMHRQLLAQTVARISTDVADEASSASTPNRFRAAAESRWSRR